MTAPLEDKPPTMEHATMIEAARKEGASGADTPPVENTTPAATPEQAAAIDAAGKEAARAERARCRDIINSPAAKQRQGLAYHLCLKTDATPEAAIAILELAAIEAAPRRSRLDGNVPSPRVSFYAPDAPQGGAVDWDLIVEKVNAEAKKNGGQ